MNERIEQPKLEECLVKEITPETMGSEHQELSVLGNIFLDHFDITQRWCDEGYAGAPGDPYDNLLWAASWFERGDDDMHIAPRAGAYISSVTPRADSSASMRYESGDLIMSLQGNSYRVRGLTPDASNRIWEKRFSGE